MNKQEIFIIGILFAVALTGAIYSNEDSLLINIEKLALTQTKIDLTQAVHTAEQHANGKAAKAEIKDAGGTLIYDIEVIHDNKAEDVKVDVKTGKVLDTPEDKDLLP